MLPGIEPGSQETHNVKILSDNHYTIAPHALGWGKYSFNHLVIGSGNSRMGKYSPPSLHGGNIRRNGVHDMFFLFPPRRRCERVFMSFKSNQLRFVDVYYIQAPPAICKTVNRFQICLCLLQIHLLGKSSVNMMKRRIHLIPIIKSLLGYWHSKSQCGGDWKWKCIIIPVLYQNQMSTKCLQ